MPSPKPRTTEQALKLISLELEQLQMSYQRNEVEIVRLCDEQNIIRATIAGVMDVRNRLVRAQNILNQVDARNVALDRLKAVLTGEAPKKAVH